MSAVVQQNIVLPLGERRVSLVERYSRFWMSLLMAASDLFALIFAALLALGLRTVTVQTPLNTDLYLRILPFILVFIAVYWLAGLYPTVGMNPVDEMRRLTIATSMTFFLLIVVSVWLRSSDEFSRLFLTLFLAFALVAVPGLRWLVRWTAVRARAWGEPIAIIGSGAQTCETVEFLRNHPMIGLLPVVMVNGFNHVEHYPDNILILHSDKLKNNPNLLQYKRIQTAVVVPNETPVDFQSLIVDERKFGFQRLVLISSLGWVGGSAIVPYDLQGVLGLEIQRKLLNRTEQIYKRMLDIAIVLIGGFFALPLIGLITLLIRLETPGGSFYGHKRIGQDGKEIKVWKFRTMMINADAVLARWLEESPTLKKEWEENHKLKDDPRITRLGNLLRKTSLDELPQLWNVLKGEMSLVGPRPIVRDEVHFYNQAFRLYTQVLPGMTGLWQVSGRSDTSYDSRVRLDEYYIRHWSIWMDIYVLLRTVWVVLRRSGAY